MNNSYKPQKPKATDTSLIREAAERCLHSRDKEPFKDLCTQIKDWGQRVADTLLKTK